MLIPYGPYEQWKLDVGYPSQTFDEWLDDNMSLYCPECDCDEPTLEFDGSYNQ